MKTYQHIGRFALLLLAGGAFSQAMGSGFALYEPSALSHAMGGALIGRAMDASANYNNPATLTDLTNIEVTVGFVTEHPRGRVRVNGETHKMDPGAFLLPHVTTAVPLPYDFTFGLGFGAEYGLGTEFGRGWPMSWSTLETTVEGVVINPNLAYKITDDWSIAAGVRWLNFDFEQDSSPQAVYPGVGYLGTFDTNLHGDNDFSDFGWQVATKYDILDNLSAGLVYKSAIDVTVKGQTRTSNPNPANPAYAPYLQAYMNRITGASDCDMTLPQSITGGLNWDPTSKWHLGTALSWTQWSEIDTLMFNLHGNQSPRELHWHDTWRASFGAAYDFIEDWTIMISYVFDMDCTSYHQASAMLPPADRHILGGGLRWKCWGGLELMLSYSCVFMDGGQMCTNDALGREYKLKTHEGFCHAGGFSVTYRF